MDRTRRQPGSATEPDSDDFDVVKGILNIKDIYCELNPTGEAFSHYAKQYQSEARLDRISVFL